MVGIGSDHRGYKLKEKIKKYLDKRHIEYIDFGTDNLETVDYNDYAYKVCKAVLEKKVDCGILVCGTGIGMSIAANKVRGIMCAKVDDADEARLAKEHNNANVIAISSHQLGFAAKDIVDSYLKANFIGTERYTKRINKIYELEKKKSYK